MAPRVNVIIGAVTSGFAKGIQGVKNSLNKIVPSGFARGLGIASLGAFSKAALVAADDINTFAARSGLSLRAVQELKFAADETDTSLEAFGTSFRRLAQAQAEALSGGQAGEAFQRLGVSLDEIKSLSPEGLFYRVAEAIKQGGKEGVDLNSAVEVLGRSSMEILPAMQTGFDTLAEKAHAFGMVMEDDVVHQLAMANDTIDRFTQKAKIGLGWAIGQVMEKVQFVGGYLGARVGGASHADAVRLSRQVQAEDAAGREAERAARKPFQALTAPSVSSETAKAAQHDGVSLALPTADALARIGLFRGGYDAAQKTREDQLRELRDMRRQIEVLNMEMTT